MNNYSNNSPINVAIKSKNNQNIEHISNSNMNSNPNLSVEEAFGQFENNSNIMNYQFMSQEKNKENYNGLFDQNSNQNMNSNDDDFFHFNNNS